MRKLVLLSICTIIVNSAFAQQVNTDSIKNLLKANGNYFTFLAVTPLELNARMAIDATYEPRLFQKSLSSFYGIDITKFQANNTATFSHRMPNAPEQQCNSAIPVCQNNYSQTASYSGFGSSQEIPSNSSCLGSQEKNSVWYTFTSQTAGSLKFLINSTADYDWALYDITGASCADIASGAVTPVRCNFSATAGNTGLDATASNNSEGSGGPPYSNPLNVAVNHTFVLIVSNYSSTQAGYTLNFSGGTADIFDVTPPTTVSASAPCGSNTINVTFTEPILCSTLAADGSDFTVGGPGGPYTVTGATGPDCGTGSIHMDLTVTPALSGGGPWTITAKNGADNNTVSDLCGNTTPVGTILINNVSPAPSTVIITGTDSACKGSLATLIASAGTGYAWTGPGGFTAITQSVSVPTSAVGTQTYNVTVQNGSCPAGTGSINVVVLSGVESDFTYAPNPVCAGQTISFTNTSILPGLCKKFGIVKNFCETTGGGCNGFGESCSAGQYTDSQFDFVWNFGDGSPSASGRPGDQTHTYSTPGTYTVSMQGKGEITGFFAGLFGGGGVACNNIKTVNIIVLPNTSTLQVRADKIICPGDTFHLKASGGATYTWKDSATGATIGTTDDELVKPTKTTKYYVETPGCGGVLTKDSITVTIKDAAIILTPKSPGICIGDSIDLTANYACMWTSNPAGFTAGPAMVVNVKPTVPTKYYCTFTTTNGCVLKDSTSIAVAGNPFTINPPIITANTCGANPPTGGISVTLNNVSTAPTYAWADSTTNAPVGGTTGVLTGVKDGGYLLTVSANGCVKTKYIHIPLGGTPTITTNYTNETICKGDTLVLVANGASNYNWQANPAIVSVVSTNSIIVQPTISTTITVDGYNTTLACKTTKIIKLTVLPNPILAVTPNTPTLCNGDSILITLSGGAQYGYDLASTFPNNLIPVVGNSFYLTPTATTNYIIAGLDMNQCPDTATLSISVNNAPIFTLGAGKTLICEDSSTVIKINSTGANTYVWTPANGLSSTTGATVTAMPVITTTYVVTATDPLTLCTKKDSIKITTKPKPLADAGKDVFICEGKRIKLTAAGGQKYWWSPKLGLSDSTVYNPFASPKVSTTYNLLTELNGCFDTASVNISVYPVTPIKAYGDTTILYGESTQIVVTGANTGTYTWAPSTEIPCETCMKNNVTPEETTYFTVVYVDLNGCVQKDTVVVTINTDYGVFIPNAFTVDGNNLNDFFTPKVWGVKSYRLQVYDRWGLRVYDGIESQPGWNGEKGSDVAPQDVYIYTLDVVPNKSSRTRKTGTITLLR